MSRFLAAIVLWFACLSPAHAAVTITFWSHEFGNSFPHAFFTLRGVPDAGGDPVDVNFGFTAKSITPKILMGSVAGEVEPAKPAYIRSSDAQFSIVLTDAQYASILSLIDEWGEKGDSHYNLNNRNCVDFVEEAARRSGLTVVEFPKLMKRPRSYLQAVAAANPGKLTVVAEHGDVYLAHLAPLTPVAGTMAPEMSGPGPLRVPVSTLDAMSSTAPPAAPATEPAPAPATN